MKWWSYVILLIPMAIGHMFVWATILMLAGLAWVFGKFTTASNCYFWAADTWMKEGGGLVVRKSKYGWWLHLQHLNETGLRDYVTKEPPRKRSMPPPLFHGRVRKT